MNVMTIGSKVLDDAILKYGKPNDLRNINRITNVSPFSICRNDRGDIITVNDSKKNPYLSKLLQLDISGKMQLEPVSEPVDGVLLDTVDMRLPYRVMKAADGTEYRITNSQYNIDNMAAIKEMIGKLSGEIKSEQLIDPLQLGDGELEEEIQAYALWLKKWFDGRKMIFCHIRNAYEVINSEYRCASVDRVEDIIALNCFYEKARGILKKYIDFEVVYMPDVFFADAREKEYHFFSYNDEVYTYLAEAVLSVLDGNPDRAEALRKECALRSQAYAEVALANEAVERLKGILNGRKPLLISVSGEVKAVVEAGLALDGIDWINISEMHDNAELQKNLGKYSSKEYACIVPKLYTNFKIMWILKYWGFEMGRDYVTCILDCKRVLKKFVGVYTDCYDNVVVSNTPNDIVINGCGNYVRIKGNVTQNGYRLEMGNDNSVNIGELGQVHLSSYLTVRLGNGSSVFIGKNTRFIIGCIIDAGNFGYIHIGDDSLFSTEVLVKCNRPDCLAKNKVIFQEHVWAGFRTTFLSGCRMDVGSIAGARTVVETVVPNNCIVGGDPAKIVKRDVAWYRDNSESRVNLIPQEYRNLTQDME